MRNLHAASYFGVNLLAQLTSITYCFADDLPFASGKHDRSSDRRLHVCDMVDDFLFNTDIEIQNYGGEMDCSEDELIDMGETLTEAHQNVINVDPRLEEVFELLVNMCETPIDNDGQPDRRLGFTFQGSSCSGCWGFNWVGSGRCRWCPGHDDDHDFRRRLGQPTTQDEKLNRDLDHLRVDSDREKDESRRLHTGVTILSFKLWSTSDESNPRFLKTLHHGDILDKQRFGPKLTVEASLDESITIGQVIFDFDDDLAYQIETSIPYLLSGKSGDASAYTTSLPLGTVGTHTITVTPITITGVQLASVTFSFLVVDGATNAGKEVTPGSREELINILEDDLSYYMSGVVNYRYFKQEGHCLEGNLVYVKANLEELINDKDAECSIDNLQPSPSGEILVSSEPGKCVDVDDGATDDQQIIVVNDCDPSRLSQKWTFTPINEKYYQIEASHSGKCMGVKKEDKFTKLARVVQYPCSTASHMLWRVRGGGLDQSFSVKATDYCLDLLPSGDMQQNECSRAQAPTFAIAAVVPIYNEDTPSGGECLAPGARCSDVAADLCCGSNRVCRRHNGSMNVACRTCLGIGHDCEVDTDCCASPGLGCNPQTTKCVSL